MLIEDLVSYSLLNAIKMPKRLMQAMILLFSMCNLISGNLSRGGSTLAYTPTIRSSCAPFSVRHRERLPCFRGRNIAMRPENKDQSDIDQLPVSVSKSSGMREGVVIFTVTFLVCVWFFTVPPAIRRTHICPTEFALQKQISGCVDIREWWKLVTDWYGSCKGMQCVVWDFSIDPETLKANGFAGSQ